MKTLSMTKVQKLPADAIFDYTDIFGAKYYHTKRKEYKVFTMTNFGRRNKVIYSRPKSE